MIFQSSFVASRRVRRMWSTSSAVLALAAQLSSCSDAGTGSGPLSCGTPPAADVCVDPRDPRAQRIVDIVRAAAAQYGLRAALFGVWIDGRELTSGALGESVPGVPATRDLHFRIGNTTESFMTTLLLEYVDEKRVSLGDRLSRWFPDVPGADRVTLEMLAASTSGYFDYVRSDAFDAAYLADPYRQWTPPELVAFGVDEGVVFAPGTSWAFSDTNFVLLGEVLERIDQQPVGDQVRAKILAPLGLDDTSFEYATDIPPPVLHGFTPERGAYEDSTFWNISWATYTANMTSTLLDLRDWATALGTGALLSPTSHERQVGPFSVGLDGLTADLYYAMGFGVARTWLVANPHVAGYNGVVAYFPAGKIVVVLFTTPGPTNPDTINDAQAVLPLIGELLTPDHVPLIPQREN